MNLAGSVAHYLDIGCDGVGINFVKIHAEDSA